MRQIKLMIDGSTRATVDLGRQGEHLATEVIFGLARFRRMYGEGRALLLHQRSGDAQPYPVATQQDGDDLRWLVTNGDTANRGVGKAELQWYVGDALAKSAVWQTVVTAALETPAEQPPDPVKPWYDRLLEEFQSGGGGGGGAVASVNGKTGAVVLTAEDVGAMSTADGESLTERMDGLEQTGYQLAAYVGQVEDSIPSDDHINALIDAHLTPLEALADEILGVM